MWVIAATMSQTLAWSVTAATHTLHLHRRRGNISAHTVPQTVLNRLNPHDVFEVHGAVEGHSQQTPADLPGEVRRWAPSLWPLIVLSLESDSRSAWRPPAPLLGTSLCTPSGPCATASHAHQSVHEGS